MEKPDIFQFVKDELEGGLCEDAGDRGGRTKWGVTQATYHRYCDEHAQPRQDVALMSDAECAAIYTAYYWDPLGLDRFPWPLNAILFQVTLHAGVRQAQELEVWSFGAPSADPILCLQATAGKPVDMLAEILLLRQLIFYCRVMLKHPDQRVFIKGWRNRVKKTAAFCGIALA